MLVAALLLLAGAFSGAPAHAQTAQTVPDGWALVPSGVSVGDSFRLLFVTSNTYQATSSDIATYDSNVQSRANQYGHTAIRPVSGELRALISTATVDARDNTLTRSTDTDAPIYWLGGAKVADNYADFYDGTWDSIERRNDAGNTVGSDVQVWTGSESDGTEASSSNGDSQAAGTASGFGPRIGTGSSSSTGISHGTLGAHPTIRKALYGLSPVFTVSLAPGKVTGVMVDQVTRDSIRVRWTKPAQSSSRPITSFGIHTRTRNAADTGWIVNMIDDDGIPNTDANGWTWRANAGASATSLTVTGLPSNVRQEVRVFARAEQSGEMPPTLYGDSSDPVEYTTDTAATPGTETALISNLGQASAGGRVVTTNNSRAQRFTTGGHAAGYTLSEVVADVLAADSGDRPAVSINTDSRSLPGAVLYTLTNPATFADGTQTWTAPADATLEANTRYYVVFRDTQSGFQVRFTDATNEDPGGVSGWNLNDERHNRTGTGAWGGGGGPLRIGIRGSLVPDAAAPVLSTATVVGASLVLTYNEPLDENSVPASSAFEVTVAGSTRALANTTPVAISGSAVTLTLASTVLRGETVTLDYTVPTGMGAQPIQDAAGNDAAALGDQAVSNNTTQAFLSTAVVNGPQVLLTYDGPLDAGSTPASSAFEVKVNGATRALAGSNPVSIAASTVTLNLASEVFGGETVTVSYTVPATDPVKDADGNLVAALTDQPVANDLADTTGPSLRTAEVSVATLTLTYNEALDTGSVPPATAFRIEVDDSAVSLAAGNAVSIGGMAVTLTLASPVAAGQTVTVDYTVPTGMDARPIRDAVGNAAAALTDQAVTNTMAGPGPTLSTAVVAGRTLTLTYNMALDRHSVPAADAFTVTVGGPVAVSAVAVAGSAVTLTLASAVFPGQTGTVSYAAPATNPIRDTAGTEAANLSNRAVTNATPGVVLSVASLVVDEGGSDTYTVRLASRPESDVTVRIEGGTGPVTWDTDGVTVGDQDTLTFTTGNWNTPQTVTVRVAADADSDNEHVTLNHLFLGGAYPGVENRALSVRTRDNANSAPVFAEGGTATRSFPENTAADTNIGAPLTATDADGDDLVYSLGGTDADSFDIVSGSGQLLTRPGARYNFEGRSSYTVTVTVTDGAYSDAITVTVSLTDVPDVLRFTEANVIGTTLWLQYDRDLGGGEVPSDIARLDTNSVPAASAFEVQVVGSRRAVSRVAITDGGIVVLTLVSAVAPGEWVRLWYTAPATNPIQDVDGNKAANLVRRGVWNTTDGTEIPMLRTATMIGPTRLRLVYDRGMDPLTLPAPSAFTVTVDGSRRAVSVTGSLLLTLASPVAFGQAVTVSYAVPAVNAIRAKNGVEAGAFDRQPVTDTRPWLVLSRSSLTMTEGGSATYTARLNRSPNGNEVRVAITSSNADVTIDDTNPNTGGVQNTLVFVSDDFWHETKTVTVRAAQDADTDPDSAILTHAMSGSREYAALSAVTVPVTVNDDDSANAAPVFATDAESRSLAENTAAGQDIGAPVTATDADAGDTLTYTLGEADAASFDIVPDTGQLRTKSGVTYDFEAKSSYAVTVTASDGKGGSDCIDVTITLTDVDEPPGAPDAPTFGDSTPTSVVVKWLAPANTGPAISDYDVQYRPGTSGSWTAHTHEGTGTTTTLEGLTDGAGYQVQVRASNDEGTGGWSASGATTASANNAPAFQNTPYSFTLVENVDGSGTAVAVGTVSATDADDGQTVTYSILADGNPGSVFAIDRSTGAIAYTGSGENFETTPSFALTVRASDGAANTDATVTVAVTDVEEPPAAPNAPTFGDATSTTVVVNWVAPANTGPAITDYDVQYRPGTSGSWTAQTHDGTGTTTTLEGLTDGTGYQVRVRATNAEGTGGWSNPGTAMPRANAAPAFQNTPYSFSLAENADGSTTAIAIGTVAATDADAGQTVSYSIEAGDDGGVFAISSAGAITYTGAGENFETTPSFTLTVRASDGAASTDAPVTVAVTDVDEPPGAPDAPTFGDATSTSVVVNWVAPANTGPAITDYDVQYRPGTSGGWTAQTHDGTETTTTLTGLTSGTSYQVQVRATNEEGTGGWSASGAAMASANSAPAFQNTPYSFTLAENADGSTTAVAVGTVSATDEDAGQTVSYSIESGDDGGVFAIASDGAITYTGGGEDHETTPSFSLTVRASDGTASTDVTATVAVTDVDEPPDAPDAPTANPKADSATSLAVGWTEPANTGPAITGYDVQYRLASTAPSGEWTAHTHSGTGTATTIGGLQTYADYQVRVRAINAEGTSDWSTAGTGAPGDRIPPALSAATVNGASLALTYNEALDANSVPAATAFAVEVNGSGVSLANTNPVAISGSTVTLTLASAVALGDTATLDYTVPDANPIQDAAGNDAAALDDQAVINTTGDTTRPALSTAAVDGATLTLTYDEALDANSVPAPGAFAVEVNDSAVALADTNPVAVSGTAVTLTLSAAAEHGDTVTLDYTVPDANPIQDAAGNAAAALDDQAVTNNTPDTAAPSLSTAAVNGASLVLTYDEALDADSVPASGAFAVEVNDRGVSLANANPVAISGSAVTLKLALAVAHGDAVTVAYTVPDANPIQDAAGNEAAALEDRAVTNNTPDTTAPALADTNPATVNGATLVLTYDEALDEGSVPARSAFTVEVAGSAVRVTNVAVDGGAVRLTLASAVEAGDTVTVSYTAPATDPIRDVAGNAAANVSDRAVVNTTDDTTAPVLRSATVIDAMLVLRYDEALDESSVPAASAFEVWVAGARVSVRNVAVDGRAVRLTLASAAAHGDTGSFSYFAPSANPIRDLAGNAAAKVSNRLWTNDTPAPADTTAPALRSAAITDATLVLAYDEGLDQDSVPAAGAFTVRAAGSGVSVANVAVSGSAVTLTLASAAAHGDTVTVSYDAPSTNPIRDPAGNAAANLSNRAVTNDTPAPGDTTAPTLSAAAITDNRVVLTYDEPLDTNSVPAGSAFTVRTSGSTARVEHDVAIAGSTVTLTLRPSTMNCGAATVSYGVPGSNPIQDPSGNRAGGLRDRAVTSAPNTPGITVTAPTPSPLREGGSATFTVKLDAMPCSMVNISLGSDNPDVTAPHHSVLSFVAVTGSGRWDRPQTVTAYSRQDHDAADETATLTLRVRDESAAEYRGLAVEVTVEVADDDTAALSVADATAQEGPGATLDFAVRLDRARHVPVTVDYATSDGTAVAGEDYTAASGTLTFAAWETEKTVQVEVLDDAHDDGGETLTLTLSNASGADIGDGEATGTIENSDPLPQAWLARFGRAAADQAMQAVSDRLTGGTSGQAAMPGLRLGGLEQYRPLGAAAAAQAAARYDAELDGPGRGMNAVGGTGHGGGFGPGAMPGGTAGGFSPAPGAGFGASGTMFGAAPGHAPGMTAGAAGFGGPGMDAAGGYAAPGAAYGAGGMHFDLGMLLAGTFFRWGVGEEDGPRLTGWGRGAATRFDGVDDGVTLSGEVVGGTVGADIERGRWVAGLALSHAAGRGEYNDAKSGAAGGIRSTLTSVHPYARASVSERLDAWGMLGYGRGDLSLGLGEVLGTIDTDLESRMGALGLVGELWSSERFRLAAKTDAMWSSTRSAATDNMVASVGDAGRARIALEGRGQFAFGAHALAPLVEIGARYDAGDAETGHGLELGLGVEYANAELGLTVETRGRVLLAHEDGGYREWGASGSVRYEPGRAGLGPRFGLTSTVGAVSSGVERMWSMQDASGLAPGMGMMPDSMLSATLGYGFRAPFWRGLATPFLELDASGASGRQRAGVLFERGERGPKLELSVERAPGYGGATYGGAMRPSPEAAGPEAEGFGMGPSSMRHEYRYQLRFSMPLGTPRTVPPPVAGGTPAEPAGGPEAADADALGGRR